MARFNNGLIYTNELCIGCNKCVSSCSILGANVSVNSGGKYIIKVDERKCSNCGKCLDACLHGARSFKDDTDAFKNDLKKNSKFSIIVDPSFFFVYGEKANKYLSILREFGVEHIYNSNVGRELSVWLNVNYVKDHKNDTYWQRSYIVNSCSSVLNQMELFNPFLCRKIIPVHSDIMCTAIYARKYLNDTNEFVVLSPCTAKNDEYRIHDKEKLIKYNLLFSRFVKAFESNVDDKIPSFVDLDTLGLSKFIPILDELEITYSYFFSQEEGVKRFCELNKQTVQEIEDLNHHINNELMPAIGIIYDCTKGCRKGPAIASKELTDSAINVEYEKVLKKSYKDYKNQFKYKSNLKKMNKLFEGLDKEDFTLKIQSRYRQQPKIPKFIYDEVYNAMYKDSPAKRQIDCGSCGYSSCYEMAKAIAYGYNKKENCIHYMNDEMSLRASVDSQTGLLTKDAFIKQAKDLISNNPDKTYLVCAGDINRFKIIDELFGTAVGDEVLSRICNKLKEIVGTDGLCGRLYGGSFILCFEYNIENYNDFRSSFRLSDENNWLDFTSYGINFPVTMRFGMCEISDGENSIEDVIGWATLARDEKKEVNKNSLKTTFTLFTFELKQNLQKEADITAAMKPALKNNEFHLWYQPQYDTETKGLAGAEALCRWIKPDGTVISPADFIPLAEKNGFIKELDEYNWKTAFETVRKWKRSGLTVVPISVNISRVSFRDDKLIPVIHGLREEYSDIKDDIHFEVTESVDIGDQEKLIERINSLKSIGVRLAMDDFGSGYSSLNTLKDLDIDYLKLDMGFLENRGNIDKGVNSVTQRKGEEIISSMIQMAKRICIPTIAEGVETEEQKNIMKKLGCNVIQGYIWGRPQPEEKFIELLKTATISDIFRRKFTLKSDLQIRNKNTEKTENSSENNEIIYNSVMSIDSDKPKCIACLSFDKNELKNTFELNVLDANNCFCDFTKCSRDEILKWSKVDILKMITPESAKNFILVPVKSLINDWHKPFTFNYKIKKSNGTEQEVTVSAKCVRNDNNTYIVVAEFCNSL